MNKNVRMPKQKRSIEKKQRIIEAASRLYYKKGYMGTTTDEIAKEAGLSTGTVYAYFHDKKDILLTWLQEFNKAAAARLSDNIVSLSNITNDVNGVKIESAARSIIKMLTTLHDFPKAFRDEMAALRYMDEDVAREFRGVQSAVMDIISARLEAFGVPFASKKEKVLLLYSIFETAEDNLVYNEDPDVDKEALTGMYVKAITAIVL